ncbi:uncharacterized protein LOC102805284, partial [Saccoglossus kowalevskii]|uniref:Uncharacterized protein LOC102805284 n=1 Tax=Saccoglossus kowalevskii TaxID=10224 RepID=A0ABM0MIY1_SACKO
ASEKGYRTVSYLRFINGKGMVHCALLMGKARVAPLKKVTIPRMELTATAISVRMDKIIKTELEYDIDEMFFWTDSLSVIRYCANETTRFHTFVANRINLIREGSQLSQWRYVDTKSNPADDSSRGLLVDDTLRTKRWLNGPQFLWKSETEWPRDETVSMVIPDGDPEVKKQMHSLIVNKQFGTDRLLSHFHFSNWRKLKITVGWLLVGKRNLQRLVGIRKVLKKSLSGTGNDLDEQDTTINDKMERLMMMSQSDSKKGLKLTPVTVEILRRAEQAIISYVQRQCFPEEIEALTYNTRLKRSSRLYKLDPIMRDGLIQVGGRLERARLPDSMKHHVVLPKDTPISHLRRHSQVSGASRQKCNA